MDTKQEKFERIERYLEGKLSQEERKVFELELEKNEELKEAVIWQQSLVQSITRSAELDLKKKLDSIHQLVVQPAATEAVNHSFLRTHRSLFMIGLWVVVGGLVGWYFIFQTKTDATIETPVETPVETPKEPEQEEKIFAQPFGAPVWTKKIDLKTMDGTLVSGIQKEAINMNIFAAQTDQIQFVFQDDLLQLFVKHTEDVVNKALNAELRQNGTNQWILTLGTQHYVVFPTAEKKDLLLIN